MQVGLIVFACGYLKLIMGFSDNSIITTQMRYTFHHDTHTHTHTPTHTHLHTHPRTHTHTHLHTYTHTHTHTPTHTHTHTHSHTSHGHCSRKGQNSSQKPLGVLQYTPPRVPVEPGCPATGSSPGKLSLVPRPSGNETKVNCHCYSIYKKIEISF